MKYVCAITLGVFLMLTSAGTPAAAQDSNQKPTVVVRDRGDGQEDVRRRGRTDRDNNVRTRGKNGRVDGREANSGRRSGDARTAETSRDREHAPVETRRRRGDDIFHDRRSGARTKQGNGPPFCRNGNGHPVHGRQWCVDKGWGLGNDRDILNRRRPNRRNPNRDDNRTILDDVLGRRYSEYILGRKYDSGLFESR